jgi:lipopolysaccharide export system permease protein
VSRFKEIAKFSTISSDPIKLGLFTVYQIPFILPMAIPLSALISSFLLFQKVSRSQELTALRASGLGFKKILAPIVAMALLLTLINFSICANLAPFCQREAGKILVEEASAAPFLILQKKRSLKNKNIFLKMDVPEQGKSVSQFILITYNESNKRLNLVTAKELSIRNEHLFGQDVSIVSHLNNEKEGFDPLIIETQDSMAMEASSLSSILKRGRIKTSASGLSLRMLQERMLEGDKFSTSALSEIFRRISFSLSVLSLTLLGAIFGIEHVRTPSKRNIIYLLLLTLTALASYLLGKGLKYTLVYAALVYFAPHLLIWIACLIRTRQITKGVV